MTEVASVASATSSYEMSPGPELMCIETSRGFIFWGMGDHNPSHSLGTYLAGREDMWRCHRFEQSWEQLMARLSAPCCSTCSWTIHRWAGPLTKGPTNHQVKGWETAEARYKVKAQKHRNLGDRAHVQVSPSIPETWPTEKNPWIKIICLLQFRGLIFTMFFCQET